MVQVLNSVLITHTLSSYLSLSLSRSQWGLCPLVCLLVPLVLLQAHTRAKVKSQNEALTLTFNVFSFYSLSILVKKSFHFFNRHSFSLSTFVHTLFLLMLPSFSLSNNNAHAHAHTPTSTRTLTTIQTHTHKQAPMLILHPQIIHPFPTD